MITAADVETDDDLETADDGSTITTEHNDLANERARDERGRFVSESEEEEEAEEEETPAKPAKKPTETEEPAAAAEGEEGADGEETEEEPAEEEEEHEEGTKPGRLSRRLTTLVERNRRLEADLAAERALSARAQRESKPAKTELDTLNESLEKLYEDAEKARADADVKTAARLQREIDATNRRIVVLENAPRARAETAAAVAAQQFNDALERIESQFSELNPNSADFDQDAAREVEFQTQAYERMGMKPKAALQRAMMLLYQVDIDDPTSKSRVRPAEEEEEEEEERGAAKKPLVKPTKVERNLAAARRGVPSPAQTAPEIEEGRIDVSKLTDEEFDALPESKLDELGGNVVRAGKRK